MVAIANAVVLQANTSVSAHIGFVVRYIASVFAHNAFAWRDVP